MKGDTIHNVQAFFPDGSLKEKWVTCGDSLIMVRGIYHNGVEPRCLKLIVWSSLGIDGEDLPEADAPKNWYLL